MKQTHTRRDKGRAVFLAALMVLSVFAMSVSFAGAAAATHEETHEEPEHTLTLTTAANAEVTINGETKQADSPSGKVTFDLVEGDYLVEVTDVPDHHDSVYFVSMPAEPHSETLTLISEEEDSTRTLDSTESTYFQGIDLVIDDVNIDENTEYDLREWDGSDPGSFETQLVPVDDSDNADTEDYILKIDTDDLDGRYVVTIGTNQYPFEIAEQSLDTEWKDESVDQNEDSELEIDSNRGTYATDITADGLDSEELVRMFEGDVVAIDDDTVRVVANQDTSLNATFDGVDAGEYTFTTSVADTTAEDESTITVEDADADASFGNSVYSEEAGDVVEYTVELEDTDSAVVNMDEEDGNYDAQLSVTDGDDDGEVTVYFNTYLASDDDSASNVFYTAEDSDDSVSLNQQNATFTGDQRLLPASFGMELSANGDRVDVATLRLSDGSVNGASTGVAPKDADLGEVDDIMTETTERDTVAEEDLVVFGFEASGIFGHLDAQEFNDAFSLKIEETSDRYGSATALNNYELVEDPENDRFFVIVDADEHGMEADEEYEVTYKIESDDYAYLEDDESVSTEFSVVERTVELTGDFDDEDRLEVGISDEATVSGESSAAPGSNVHVTIEGSGDSPFLMSEPVEVDEDGTFTATFDTSDLEVGSEFDVSVEDRNASEDVSDETKAIFVEDDSYQQPHSVTVTVEDKDGNAVSDVEINAGDESATTDDDGKAVLELAHGDYKISASYDGEDASGKLTVDDETPDEVTLTLGEEDVDLNPDEKKDNENKNDDKQNDNNDEKNGDNNNDDEQPGSGADDDQPGFGIIVALIALLAAAGFALRRQ